MEMREFDKGKEDMMSIVKDPMSRWWSAEPRSTEMTADRSGGLKMLTATSGKEKGTKKRRAPADEGGGAGHEDRDGASLNRRASFATRQRPDNLTLAWLPNRAHVM